MSNAATIDFFGHQEQARKNTAKLVGYFLLAVVMIMVSVYLVIAGFLIYGKSRSTGESALLEIWNPAWFSYVAGGTLLIVVLGSLYKTAQLAGGGKAVAKMLGGRLVSADTADIHERRFLNVVEEMAIASGTPVPPAYLMDNEQGINAFAAGFSPSDAVVAVTRGCLEQLSRDELQGVIAHEFSHILNGDMRLNIRLMGVLHGILVIALIGYWLMRSTAHSSRSSRNSKGSGGIAIVGLGIMVVGYIGVFFGKLIKSAVSRQREFLADASAVQFTRNPDGIGGALAKIGGLKGGSRIQNPSAEEASHLFFSNGLSSSFLGMFASHPPLEERISRISPALLDQVDASKQQTTARADVAPGLAGVASGLADVASQVGLPDEATSRLADVVSGFTVQPETVVADVGTPRPEHLAHARQLRDRVPADLLEAARTTEGACAIVYAMLTDSDPRVQERQRAHLAEHAAPAVRDTVTDLAEQLTAQGPDVMFLLLDLSIGALKQLTEPAYRAFAANVTFLVEADESIELFEFMLQRMLTRHLEPVFSGKPRVPVRYHTLSSIAEPVQQLLSSLAHWGADDPGEAAPAFAQAVARLKGAPAMRLADDSTCGLQQVGDALDTMRQASPLVKRMVIDAAVACIAADGHITIQEAELVRLIGDSLDCPIPPFLPGQAV